MKNFKKFLPLILFALILAFGAISFIRRGLTFFSLSILVVGIIGFLAVFFVMLSKKNFERNDEPNPFSSLSNTIKQTIEELNEQNKENIEKEFKHKKVICPYCKCKYDNSLPKCPNCGAPPDFER